MLKKLLTGCLTIAMIGAFSASVSAETTFTWTGNVTAGYYQSSSTAPVADAETISYTDMSASGDLDLSAKTAGDVWTGEAKIELDVDAAGVSAVDDLYVVASKDGLALTFGEFDPFGIGKGDVYVADIDDTVGAGGINAIFGEQGVFMVGLPDVGLNILVGMNKVDPDEDATGDVFSLTTFGVNYSKAFGDFALAVGYYSASGAINEDDDPDVAAAKDSAFDGFSASEISLAAQYTLGEMAFTLNYTSYGDTQGDEATNADTVMELLFDMGIGDDMGFTAGYTQVAETDNTGATGADDIVTTTTNIIVSFMFKLGPVENYATYQTATNQTDVSGSEAGSDSTIGYMMKVGF